MSILTDLKKTVKLQEAGPALDKVRAELEPHVKKLAQMTDQNLHPEAMLYAAEHVLKDRQMVAVLQGLIALHKFYGSMDSHLSHIYHDLGTKLEYRIKDKFGQEVGSWFIQGSF